MEKVNSYFDLNYFSFNRIVVELICTMVIKVLK